MEILQTIYEFTNKECETTCGLYHVKLDSGATHYLLRNNDSVAVIAHLLGRLATECLSLIKDDVKKEFFDKLEGK